MKIKRLVGLERPVIITRRVYFEKPRVPTDREFFELINLGLLPQKGKVN